MNENIYEALQNSFVAMRFLHSGLCPVSDRFDIEKSNIKSIKAELSKTENTSHWFLIYCIDSLLEIIEEGDRQKIFDFADLVHNMTEITMSKRSLKSFKGEIADFNNKYNTDYFFSIFKGFWRNNFTTETDGKYVKLQSVKATVTVFLILSLLGCIGFLVSWQTVAFLEITISISCLITLVSRLKNEHCWRLRFEDDDITVINLKTNESFYVCDIPASDIVVNQTKNEKGLDYCSVMIKNTSFAFGGVKKCQDLKEYIKENFK